MENVKNKILYNFSTYRKDMTLVIGAVCKDGVVIIADKKVVEGSDIGTQDKIYLLNNLII